MPAPFFSRHTTFATYDYFKRHFSFSVPLPLPLPASLDGGRLRLLGTPSTLPGKRARRAPGGTQFARRKPLESCRGEEAARGQDTAGIGDVGF